MNPEKVAQAGSYQAIAESSAIGCYRCLALYKKDELTLPHDAAETPTCPRCGQATLIGDSIANDLSPILLVNLRRRYVNK